MREHVFSILGGILAGIIGVTAIEVASALMYPLPPGIDTVNKEAMRAHFETLPVGALAMVLLAHATGGFLGGATTAFLSRRKAYDRALVIGLLLMVAGIMTLFSMPHPLWFALADVVLYVPTALFGCFVVGSLVERRRPRSNSATD